MKSAEQIEQSLRRLHVEAGAERREQTLSDLVEAHTREKEKTRAFSLLRYGRTIMRQKPKRIAAVVALAVLLLGVFSLSTGSVAFSQARHAVNSTLSWLKGMITGDTTALPPEPANMGKQTPNSDRRAVICTTSFFTVREAEQSIWQSLKDQGIELVKASTDPEVYYAALSREQAESFDASLTLKCWASPRVTVLEGETAAIAITDRQPPRGIALGWLPTVSSDGKEIQSTISFHDGRNGFEIPNVSVESGGVVLVYAKGMFFDFDQEDGGEQGGPKEVLIRLQVDIP